MRRFLLVPAVALALAGCAAAPAVSDDEYNKVAAQAESEIKVANKMGFLWRDTEKFLKESKEHKKAADDAKKAGDSDKANKEMEAAMKLAKRALKQAQLAQQQAKDQANPQIDL